MQNDDNVTAMEIKTQLMRKRVRENIVKKALEPFAWRMEIRSIPRIQTTIEVNLSTNKFERENNILKNKRLRKLKSNFVIEDNRQRKEL